MYRQHSVCVSCVSEDSYLRRCPHMAGFSLSEFLPPSPPLLPPALADHLATLPTLKFPLSSQFIDILASTQK